MMTTGQHSAGRGLVIVQSLSYRALALYALPTSALYALPTSGVVAEYFMHFLPHELVGVRVEPSVMVCSQNHHFRSILTSFSLFQSECTSSQRSKDDEGRPSRGCRRLGVGLCPRRGAPARC